MTARRAVRVPSTDETLVESRVARPLVQPRSAAELRNLQVARLLTSVCTALPVGFWQRRLAARAFGLSIVPPVDRFGTTRAVATRRGGDRPVLVLQTPVARWALVPQLDRDPIGVLQQLRSMGLRPFTAIVMLVPGVCAPEARRAIAHRQGRMTDAVRVGALDWRDVRALLEDTLEAFSESDAPYVTARRGLADLDVLERMLSDENETA